MKIDESPSLKLSEMIKLIYIYKTIILMLALLTMINMKCGLLRSQRPSNKVCLFLRSQRPSNKVCLFATKHRKF